MATLTVVQHFRVTRTITLNVEGDDATVQERYDDGEIALPEWSDERWKENWTLVAEEAATTS